MRDFDASYLLRVWRDDHDDEAWRASLRNLRSQEVRNFQTLAQLAVHIVAFGNRADPKEKNS